MIIGAKYTAKTFFYLQKLNQRVRVAKIKALFQTAGLVRTATKRSMRLRGGASRSGTPPHAHTRAGLRQIEFVVDFAAGAAIIGPVKFPGSNYFNEPVPHIHEFGGIFLARRGYWTYPQRSYMNYTLKKLVAAGRIPRQFSIAMGHVL